MNFSVSTIILTSIVACAILIYFPYLFVVYARFQVGMDDPVGEFVRSRALALSGQG